MTKRLPTIQRGINNINPAIKPATIHWRDIAIFSGSVCQ